MISAKFLAPQDICDIGYTGDFSQKSLSSHLEFLCKTQKLIYLGNSASNFDKILARRMFAVNWRLFLKIAFPPFLAAFLYNAKTCLSWKRSEIERFRQNFCPTGCLQSLLATFPKNCFPATFGGHLKFLRKTQKRFYL